MTVYLANAFSLSMLSQLPAQIKVMETNPTEITAIAFQNIIVSAVGHEGTAQLLSQILGFQVPVNRVSIKLAPSDILIVFQLLTRLPEGRVLTADEIKQLQYKFYIVKLL